MQKMTTKLLDTAFNQTTEHNIQTHCGLSDPKAADSDVCTIRPKILIVEDNLVNQKVAQLFLKNLGYQSDIAVNGQQALAIFNHDYALILMDLGLPDMDGIEITKKIREKNKQVPIIACTASGESYKTKCLDAGMDDFIVKPMALDALEQMLGRFLIIKETN